MNKNIAIASLGLLSAILVLGWVLPKVPYSRRMSAKKAEDLWKEYLNIVQKDVIGLNDSIRKDEISRKLASAGYTIVEDRGEGNKVVRPLLYPSYSK